MKEVDLSLPATLWLKERKCEVWAEVPVLHRCADLVGRNDSEIHIVELKMSATRKLINQAYFMHTVADYSWGFVPTVPRAAKLTLFERLGVGLLAWDGVNVNVLVEARRNKTWAPEVNRLNERLDAFDPGGLAGAPTQKGVGPAIDCAERCVLFIAEVHPKTWKEVYENVPNHYCSPSSMASAMRMKGIKLSPRNNSLTANGEQR